MALPTAQALKQLPGCSLDLAFKKFNPTVLKGQAIVDDLFDTSLGLPLTSEIAMIEAEEEEESLKGTKQIQGQGSSDGSYSQTS